jgi:hypothetical protein
MKTHQVRAELFHVDRWTDEREEDSRNSSNMRKNSSYKGVKRGMIPVIYSVQHHRLSQI